MIPAHPLADLFPMLSPADAEGLRADIAANGLRERIVVLDGRILDGRNRYRAAVGAGVITGDLPEEGGELWVSHFRRFNPAQDGEPLAWVLSKNLHRRHLSDGQRAMVAADIANMRQGARTDLDSSERSANLPKVSQADAAGMLHVSTRSVTAAKSVVDHGAPELAERVRSGDLPVSTAAEAAKLSVGDQMRLLREQNPRDFASAVRKELAKPRDARSVMNSRVQPPDDLDYSPTPPWATRCLTKIILPHLGCSLAGMAVREPACGEGHISAVLQEERPLQLWASDIFDYSVDGLSAPGWQGTCDYLDESLPQGGADWVITNPPFAGKGEAFAHRALGEAAIGVALFMRLGWLASNGRYNRLFSINPPTLVAVFAEDVPLHMGRWEPDGSTASDYMWLVWVKDKAPQPTFWVPPGQRLALSNPDDVARFTAHPVVGMAEVANAVSAVSAGIAADKATALPIIEAEYTGDNAQALADRLGRPVNTIRKWAFELNKTSRARNVDTILKFNRERAQ